MRAGRKPTPRRRPRAAREEPSSLTDQAYRRIEELIVTLQLAPGESASEAELSARIGIGRTPIREALQRLAREKLVSILPRRGIVVSEINVGTQLRLLETRREVERLIVRRAARRGTPAMRAVFAELAQGMQEAARTNDDIAFMRLDRELNLLVIEAAENEFAAGAMTLMHGLARRFWYQHYKRVADMPLAARLHADVARAIAAGDERRAATASDLLIDYIEDFARAAVDDG